VLKRFCAAVFAGGLLVGVVAFKRNAAEQAAAVSERNLMIAVLKG
jgi:hypothetical protein